MNAVLTHIRSQIASLDRRLLVIASALIGFAAWQVSLETVLLINAFLFLFLWLQASLLRLKSPAAKSYAFLIIFWTISKFLLDTVSFNTSLETRILDASTMAARLLSLAFLSFIITYNASPRKMGAVLAWFSKPFLRKNSWKASLALALMLSAMVRIGRTLKSINQTLYLRNPTLPVYRRFMLIGLTTLRILAQESENITIAIASRDLYRPEPWEPEE